MMNTYIMRAMRLTDLGTFIVDNEADFLDAILVGVFWSIPLSNVGLLLILEFEFFFS